jgi:hypothetical protein
MSVSDQQHIHPHGLPYFEIVVGIANQQRTLGFKCGITE